MPPCPRTTKLTPKVTRAEAVEAARQEGYQLAMTDVQQAEAQADAMGERLLRLRALEEHHAEFQAVVADVLLWLDGFDAAFAGRELWDRPNLPSREQLRKLNAALQRVTADEGEPEEVPF